MGVKLAYKSNLAPVFTSEGDLMLPGRFDCQGDEPSELLQLAAFLEQMFVFGVAFL